MASAAIRSAPISRISGSVSAPLGKIAFRLTLIPEKSIFAARFVSSTSIFLSIADSGSCEASTMTNTKLSDCFARTIKKSATSASAIKNFLP